MHKLIGTFFIAIAVFFLLLTRTQANGDGYETNSEHGWQFSVSAGAVVAPHYLGDDEYQVSAFPNVTVRYKDLLFASIDGVGINAINTNGFRAGPIAKYNFGRDDDGSNPLGLVDDTNDLVGLGDVDGTVELGGFIEYTIKQFTAKLEVRQGIGGHEGLIGKAELKYGDTFTALGMPIFYSLGPEVAFADANYNSAFFDVNAAQSAASGLPTFNAGAGLNSVGLHGTIVMPVTEKISVIGFAGYDRLMGDVADSSLVRLRGSKDQGIAGILLNYTF